MEARRSARVISKLLVAIEAHERAPALRDGDISATGIYFATDVDAGEVGTIQWLRVLSLDGERSVHVMGYVVRNVVLRESPQGALRGVALEFMPESEATTQVLQELVRYVLGRPQNGGLPHVASRLAAKIQTPVEASGATVRELSVRSMVLETSWDVAPGEQVIVEILAPGRTRKIRLDGRAIRSAQKQNASSGPAHYEVEVEVTRETERPIRVAGRLDTEPPPAPEPPAGLPDPEISHALDHLLSALIEPSEGEPGSRCHHLSGEISRIRLPTLCSLFELDRMTGKLVAQRGADRATIFVHEGQLIDVEPVPHDQSPRARLSAVLGWEDGSFELDIEPVDRPDRVGVRTMALLLDLAREADEAARGSDEPS